MQKQLIFLIFLLLFGGLATAQIGKTTDTTAQKKQMPRDGIHDNKLKEDRHSLHLTTPNERDISYSKIVWREIIFEPFANKIFVANNYAFIDSVLFALRRGDIISYAADDFKNEIPLEKAARAEVHICFVESEEDEKRIREEASCYPADIISKIRIKEGWYFDEKTGKMEVATIGLAFIIKHENGNGDLIAERPAFWLYYPAVRPFFAKLAVPNQPYISWADIFEGRKFESYITKESSLSDSRIKDNKRGIDGLLEAERIKKELQNREADRYGE